MVFIGAITWQLKCREQMDSLLGRRARTYMPSIISPECALFSTACGCSIMLRFNGLRGLSATNKLWRLGAIAHVLEAVYRQKTRSRFCSSLGLPPPRPSELCMVGVF
jgi:hypothetical protein